MKKIFHKRLIVASFVLFFVMSVFAISTNLAYGNLQIDSGEENMLQNLVYIKTSNDCRIIIKLLDSVAPNHVKRFKELVRSKFYNGVSFHRVIDGFMAQAGAKNGDLNYGSGKKINAEFSNMHHVRGIVSMARGSDVNSADSQFFIVLKDSLFLDNQYTIFGNVIGGMDCVDNIKKGKESENGIIANSPTEITAVDIAYDIEVKNLK